MGNGYGVSDAAEVSYEEMLARFSSTDAGIGRVALVRKI
jgi:hypothetical protein